MTGEQESTLPEGPEPYEWQPDEPDSEELVDLGEGQAVPRRFQLPIYAGGGIPVKLLVTVEMEGTRAKVADVRLTPAPEVTLIDPTDLARINWPAVLRSLIQLKAMQTAGYLYADPRFADASERADDMIRRGRERRKKAARAATRTLRRNAVTPDDLAEIVRLVEVEGVAGAVEKTGKSRSYIYKLLARAQEELS